MFERFTKSARAVVVGAQGQARDLRHPYIGPEHLLLALLDEDVDGGAKTALNAAGIQAADVRDDVIRRVGMGAEPLGPEDAEALQEIGIDLDAVRTKAEESFGPGALDEQREESESIEETDENARRLVDWLRGRKRPGGARGPRRGHIPFSPRSKKVLELSLREALRLRHDHIGTEHILLGLLREGEGLAVQILVNRGVDVDALRRRTVAGLKKPANGT
jgi:ATP-dependent Clp protease ATP-binding subunit ClpA